MTEPRQTGRWTESIAWIGPRHDGRAWATFFLAAMVLLASVPLVGSASAQGLPVPLPGPLGEEEPSEEPTEESTEEEESPLPVAPPGGDEPAAGDLKTAYYTSPTSAALPATAIQEFPPGVVCLVVPEFCSEDARTITAPIQDGVMFPAIEGVDTAGQSAPAQPVPPEALPVGILSGNQRYSSALGIPLPEVPEGQQFGSLLITMQMSDMSFSLESPAFRNLALGALASYQNDDPTIFFNALQQAGSDGSELFTQNFPGLEMCVIKTPWDAGRDQPRADQPQVDPLFCSPRTEPAEDGTVTFDMTFPANDSLPSGFVPGWEGVLIRPLGAQNLAYGDADYSTNYYAYFENPAENPPAVTAEYVEGPADYPVTPPGSNSGISSGGASSSGFGGGSSGSGSSSGSSGSRPSTSGGTSAIAAPGLANPGAPGGADAGQSLEVPGAGDDVAAQSPLDAAPTDAPSSAWIPWVLLPMLLGGALWYGRVLEASPIGSIVRAGAMTTLLRERGFQI